jgi:hypothetical protein
MGPPNNGFWFLGLVGGLQQPRWIEIRYEVLSSGLSHLSRTRPRSTPPKQAPRSHGAERKYYMFGSARHPDKSNRRPPIHTRSSSGLVLHILWSYRLKRHLETRSLWWHWHRVTGIGKGFHSPSTRRRGMVCSSAFAGACHCKPIERLRVDLWSGDGRSTMRQIVTCLREQAGQHFLELLHGRILVACWNSYDK